MSDALKRHALEGRVGQVLIEEMGQALSARHEYAGLRWSSNMDDDDPNADLLVIDVAGVEYLLEVTVDLTPTADLGRTKKPA